ncbi:RmlC-like cupin domain-containing protein [Mycena pura]|uniref:RmlC-like cupin domain-containing protein n=1 Tax=Mycena pura TaxID=153505 RepID=A0AAD7E153_9AGAR|nr:RmlC-like cupin domain-containing protein [Mycena pura]
MLFPYAIVLVVFAAPIVHGAPTASSVSQPPPAVSQPPSVPVITNGSAIAAELLVEASSVDRFTKLLTDSNGVLLTGEALRELTVFDFNQQLNATVNSTGIDGDAGVGGSILISSVDNFPILTELGISGAASFIAPCGLNIPHLHPRSDEFFTLVEGVLDTGFVLENGFTQLVTTQLGKFQATVFPKGSLHFQQNPTCDPAVFVAGFDSSDPGRSDLANNLWQFPGDVVNAALGFPDTIDGTNIEAWRAHLPFNLAAGVDSCLQACGLTSEE